MSLSPGSRLGVYEVIAQIGAGGMGEVYRATDTTLKRAVAIKVLPAAVADDADRLGRFQREAEVLAALNHPNIAAIYGLEKTPGFTALVMELVEGEDLSQRLVTGPIPLDEALPIARQIAAALEAAHEQGIVHRDLKPANIKVRADGAVKVLDFGLAKAMEPAAALRASAGHAVSQSPTITTPAMTQMGMILGTAAYMSPEQAKGRAVDRRADVWAFGAVLYEMLTGQRAFAGEDVPETLVAIMRDEPDWSRLPSTLSPSLRAFIQRCLQKDLKQRIPDIATMRLAIDGAFDHVAPQMTAVRTSMSGGWIAWAIAALALIGLATVSFLRFRDAPVVQPRVHLSVPLPDNVAPGHFALSPDGRSLAITNQNQLQIRSLESGEIRLLSGTTGVRIPFWSPDSRTIGFFADNKLKTIAASGGPPQTLCDGTGLGAGGSWNRDGVIVFATDSGVINRVSATGGACSALTMPAPDNGRPVPVFLPDGAHFLYVVNGTDETRRGLYVASLGDLNGRRLLTDPSSAVFVPDAPGSNQGRLLFVRDETLMAQRFDAATVQLSGEPVTVANQVSFTNSLPQIAVSASDNGTVVYLTNGRPERQLIWYDRTGAEHGRAAMTGTGPATAVSLAPDGKHVAFRRTDAQGLFSLWVQDLERNQETRLTTPPLSPSPAVWTPDSKAVVFRATGRGADGIYIKNVNGQSETMLLAGSNTWAPSDWSRDDHSLLYTEINPTTGADIWLLANPSTPSAERKPVPILRTPSIESQGQISPDGKWLAYVSIETGTLQVYVRPFRPQSSDSDTRWQVSSLLSAEPRWRADSKELFFLAGGTRDVTVMAVPIGDGPNPVGGATRLFAFPSLGTIPQSNSFRYSATADGQRFLVNANVTKVDPSLELVLNWSKDR